MTVSPGRGTSSEARASKVEWKKPESNHSNFLKDHYVSKKNLSSDVSRGGRLVGSLECRVGTGLESRVEETGVACAAPLPLRPAWLGRVARGAPGDLHSTP